MWMKKMTMMICNNNLLYKILMKKNLIRLIRKMKMSRVQNLLMIKMNNLAIANVMESNLQILQSHQPRNPN